MSAVERLRERLAAGAVVLLDGGTGTELEARGVPMHGEVWSALAAVDHPEILRAVHEDDIRAGAEIVIANTFAANRLVLEPAGLGGRVAEINRAAVELAVAAREAPPTARARGRVADAARGRRRARRGRGRRRRARVLPQQVAAQAQAGVDLVAIEMVPSALHGAAAVAAAAEAGLPALLGLTTAWPGQDLGALAAELAAPNVIAVAAMHCEIADTGTALDAIERGWPGPLGAYPHHGGWEPPHWVFHEIAPERFAADALGWVARGVQLVGGCCGIGPAISRGCASSCRATCRPRAA